MHADALRRRLEEAGELVAWPGAMPDALVGVSADSRAVVAGGLFVAYRGVEHDGHAFLPSAVERGATAAIVEQTLADVAVPQIVVRNGRAAAAAAAALFHGDPAAGMAVIGVTGTNGKTTTVHMLRHLLGADGTAASIGTLGAIVGDGAALAGTMALTTPGPVELQGTLARLRDAGVRTVALEVSSHSLDQERVAGLRLAAAVYTNFTREHLEYHPDEAAYLAAKLRLTSHLADGAPEVVNADVAAWQQLPDRAPRVTFGVAQPADVRGSALTGDARSSTFNLTFGDTTRAAVIPLIGAYNVENALGAAATALALGRDFAEVVERLGSMPQVPGRMERLADQPCIVLRDYAHTPDGVERALGAVRPLAPGRLIVVFGCGGDRDRGKRPIMGAITARIASLVILTEDNPRTEDPRRIMEDIGEGMGDTPHLRIVNRREAIARAMNMARPGDIILLMGKGHETYQIIGREKHPFDEAAIVREIAAATP